jgi:type IV secretory pathway VirJ component
MLSGTMKGAGDRASDPVVALAEQQHALRMAQQQRKVAKRKEERLRVSERKAVEERAVLEEERTVLAAEAEAQAKELKRMRAQYEKRMRALQQDMNDLEEEFAMQRESLMNQVREQEKEVKLLEQVIDTFISPAQMAKIWERAVWDEESGSWALPQFSARPGVHARARGADGSAVGDAGADSASVRGCSGARSHSPVPCRTPRPPPHAPRPSSTHEHVVFACVRVH